LKKGEKAGIVQSLLFLRLPLGLFFGSKRRGRIVVLKGKCPVNVQLSKFGKLTEKLEWGIIVRNKNY
jgi:hypothetical protein